MHFLFTSTLLFLVKGAMYLQSKMIPLTISRQNGDFVSCIKRKCLLGTQCIIISYDPASGIQKSGCVIVRHHKDKANLNAVVLFCRQEPTQSDSKHLCCAMLISVQDSLHPLISSSQIWWCFEDGKPKTYVVMILARDSQAL